MTDEIKYLNSVQGGACSAWLLDDGKGGSVAWTRSCAISTMPGPRPCTRSRAARWTT